MSTLYLKADQETISKYVIFSGDPWRVEMLQKLLDDPKHVAFSREFNTYTGTYQGVPITISSTGIGAPSAAIAMEELYDCGMEVAIRMGTVMGLKEGMLGKVLIPNGAMRLESTSDSYVPKGFPAVASIDLINVMNQSVKNNNREYLNGISATMDGFYSQMRESRLSKKMNTDILKTFDDLEKFNVSGVDMETSLMLVLGNLMDIKVCSVTMTTVLRNLSKVLEGEERTKAEQDLCKIVLDGIVLLDQGEKQS
ncbi:nucleoside phosphorylase [Proteiniclasticum sp. SCR006]|uniref:Uridine phosphorylase n=1 Tax=Proteiniclasticum aestuarii TaxID=2817862 RepID=A0A939H6D8_9CLOT|nr:nucleoside phosphorylase [Proteiniclasticum aestuarii]MBO1265097.1 nucleoside phosphorylase [Proteiniclasticum aestuarii]